MTLWPGGKYKDLYLSTATLTLFYNFIQPLTICNPATHIRFCVRIFRDDTTPAYSQHRPAIQERDDPSNFCLHLWLQLLQIVSILDIPDLWNGKTSYLESITLP